MVIPTAPAVLGIVTITESIAQMDGTYYAFLNTANAFFLILLTPEDQNLYLAGTLIHMHCAATIYLNPPAICSGLAETWNKRGLTPLNWRHEGHRSQREKMAGMLQQILTHTRAHAWLINTDKMKKAQVKFLRAMEVEVQKSIPKTMKENILC